MPPVLSDFADRNPVSTGVIGSFTSYLATAAGGWMEQANAWFSLLSTIVGLFAGIMTVCLAWDRWIRWARRKRRPTTIPPLLRVDLPMGPLKPAPPPPPCPPPPASR